MIFPKEKKYLKKNGSANFVSPETKKKPKKLRESKKENKNKKKAILVLGFLFNALWNS